MKFAMNTTVPLRVGLIGVGKHARQILIPAAEQIPDAIRFVALATGHAESARKVESFYRLPCAVGHEAIIGNPDVEAVIISSHDHERHAIDALEAGKHVFIETPGITSREGARRIRRLSQERCLVYHVGSCLRYSPIYQKMKRLLAEWRERTPGPRTFSVRYYSYIGHFQNLLLYLAGDITHVLNLMHADRSSAVALYRFASGDIASITWGSFHNVAFPYESVEIIHSSGRLIAEDGRVLRFDRMPPECARSPLDMDFELADAQLFNPTFSIPYGRNMQQYLRGYVPQLEDFARCVRTGDTPLCGVGDAEKTLLVGEASGKSAEAGGTWVAVES